MVRKRREHATCEFKANDQLMKNVTALTTKYSCRNQLKNVLQKYMFVRLNTNAFNELAYYLGNLKYMVKTKGTFANWPPTNESEQLALCGKILRHVIKLNYTYKNANIPLVKQMQLNYPVGLKIANFFLKWSELCMLEHLRTLPDIFPQILHPIKSNIDPAKTTVMLKAVRKQNAGINAETRTMMKNYKKLLIDTVKKVKTIRFNFVQLITRTTCDLLLEDYPEDIHLETVNKEIVELINNDTYFDEFRRYSEEFDKIEEMRINIMNDKILVHNKERFKVPEEIEYIIENADTLDLYEYFCRLKVFLENINQDLPTPSTEFLKDFYQVLQRYKKLTSKLKDLATRF